MMKLQSPPFNPGDLLYVEDTFYLIFYSLEPEFDSTYAYMLDSTYLHYKSIYVYKKYLEIATMTLLKKKKILAFT